MVALYASALAQGSPATATDAHEPATHPAPKRSAQKKGKTARTKKTSRKRGQQVIDSARARQIQEALIREHYLVGPPTGKWDSTSQAAMQRYQADQGWQSKTIPDSRALIKLGLGPSNDHLLNPESAMTSGDPTPESRRNPKAGAADPQNPNPSPNR